MKYFIKKMIIGLVAVSFALGTFSMWMSLRFCSGTWMNEVADYTSIVAISLGFISLIYFIITKSRWIIGAVPAVILGLLALVTFIPCTVKAPDARVFSAISQAKTVMAYLFEKEGHYDNFNCKHPDMVPLCEEIDSNYGIKDGREPIITTDSLENSQRACIYSPVESEKAKWVCADSSEDWCLGWTNINPGNVGYCVEGESAVCPPLEGAVSKLPKEEKPPEEKIPEKAVEDETANWKIHHNERYGFEVKYPENGEAEEIAGTHLLFYLNVHLNKTKVVLLIKENENQMTLRDFILEPYREGCVVSFAGECHPDSEASKAALSEAEAGITSFQSQYVSGLKIYNDYYFQKDNLVYVIFMPVRQTKEDTEILEKIVSTFRFLE